MCAPPPPPPHAHFCSVLLCIGAINTRQCGGDVWWNLFVFVCNFVFVCFCNCVFVCYCICAILHLCIIVKQRTGQTVWRRWVAGSAPRSLPRNSGPGAARHTTRVWLPDTQQDTTRHTARHPGDEHLLNTPRPESIYSTHQASRNIL